MRRVMPLGVIACLLMGARCDGLQPEEDPDAEVCGGARSHAQCAQGVPDAAVPRAGDDDDADAGSAEVVDADPPRIPVPDSRPQQPSWPVPPKPPVDVELPPLLPLPATAALPPVAPPTANDGQLDCAAIKAEQVPQGIDRFASFAGVTVLSTDATRVHGVRFGESWEELWSLADPTMEAVVATTHLDAVQVVVPDGDEIFFNSASSGSDVVVSKVNTKTGEVLHIAREDYANVNALTVVGDRVFWLANVSRAAPGSTALFQTEREPGETLMLARIDGDGGVHNSLVHLGNALYFAVYAPDWTTSQLYRLSFDEDSKGVERVGEPAGIAGLATDGVDLYAALIPTRDRLGNAIGPRGVARVDLEDGSFELLFPDLQQAAGMLAVDGTSIHWMTPPQERKAQLWTAKKDGSEPPRSIAQGWEHGSVSLVQNAAGLFWTVTCGDTQHVMRAPR